MPDGRLENVMHCCVHAIHLPMKEFWWNRRMKVELRIPKKQMNGMDRFSHLDLFGLLVRELFALVMV
eukprot:NODE_1471_length_1153_cov_93.815217_g1204_i0.p4 GENE.NODE_1471_length_1153_cov_93.815217_g1204_i0~~NODE_1471_length_1153_cov_93.815217_g1204_i0.p4  ORF type:complete len:67 (+),score=2.22 NODE_1471_length_1153_cov_93.815217_g1204_i0:787-987(+)